MNAALQHQARKLAALLPPLLVEAERVAAAVHQGIHGRRRAGSGESFWQFRRYAAGDAATRIDWRQSARTDRLFVREREWEAAQSVYLWSDRSGSMRYASQSGLPQKSHRADVLMLALANLLIRGGERVVWMSRETRMARIMAELERIAVMLDRQDTEASVEASIPPDIRLAKHAHMVLTSDFLMPPAALEQLLQRYAALNLRGVLVHILDPAEEDLPFDGRLELRGCEGETPMLLKNARALREDYRSRMQDHKARLTHYAECSGWFYLAHNTAAAPHDALMKVFQYFSADRRGL